MINILTYNVYHSCTYEGMGTIKKSCHHKPISIHIYNISTNYLDKSDNDRSLMVVHLFTFRAYCVAVWHSCTNDLFLLCGHCLVIFCKDNKVLWCDRLDICSAKLGLTMFFFFLERHKAMQSCVQISLGCLRHPHSWSNSLFELQCCACRRWGGPCSQPKGAGLASERGGEVREVIKGWAVHKQAPSPRKTSPGLYGRHLRFWSRGSNNGVKTGALKKTTG